MNFESLAHIFAALSVNQDCQSQITALKQCAPKLDADCSTCMLSLHAKEEEVTCDDFNTCVTGSCAPCQDEIKAVVTCSAGFDAYPCGKTMKMADFAHIFAAVSLQSDCEAEASKVTSCTMSNPSLACGECLWSLDEETSGCADVNACLDGACSACKDDISGLLMCEAQAEGVAWPCDFVTEIA